MANYKGKYIKLINNKFVDDRIIIKDHKPEPLISKMKIHYICDICGEDYITGPIRKGYTHFCRKHTFHYVCDWCHEEFQITRLSDFISDKDLRFCCRNHALQYRNRTPEMVQAVIDKNIKASKESLSIDRVCIVCDRHFKSAMPNDICNSCITTYTNYETGSQEQECIICGAKFYSTFKMAACHTCFLEHRNKTTPSKETIDILIIGLALGKISQEEFKQKYDKIPKNNLHFSDDKIKFILKYNENSNKIHFHSDKENNKIKDKVYIEEQTKIKEIKRSKLLQEIKYRKTYIIRSTTFKIIENIKYVYSNVQKRYVIWEDYKKKLEEPNKITDQFGFQMIRTFRDQDSDSWEHNKPIFEQYLNDLNIENFVYIKYYIDKEENLKPLVVGITASNLVNSSGTDLIFDYDPKSGPARRFLIENNYDWLKTHISIFPTRSREESLKLESLISSEYDILNS